MGKFDDLYGNAYDMTDEKKLGLEISMPDPTKAGGVMTAVGAIMQLAGAAAAFVTAYDCSEKEAAYRVVYDSEHGVLLPPEPYGSIAVILLIVIAVGSILSLAGRLAAKKWAGAFVSVITGLAMLGFSLFMSSSFYGDMNILPLVKYSTADGGGCEILFADNTVVNVCDVFLLHDGVAYRADGCSSDGGIKRTYHAVYNSEVFLPAYDVTIYDEGGTRHELVYTYDNTDF